METAGKKKFVTGATGYVGRHLVRSLVAKGYGVYALSRTKTDLFSDAEHVQVIIGDITESFSMPDDVDTIYHCAGVIRDTQAMESTNVTGTKNMINCAIKNNCTLIHLGSAGVAGKTDALIIDEETPCHPRNAYEISKYKAEQLVTDAIAQGLRALILRPTTIFGSDMKPDGNSFLQLTISMRNGTYRTIGHGIYNIIHIDEVVKALELLDDPHIPNGGIYILNDPIAYADMNAIVKHVPPSVTKKSQTLPYPVAFAAMLILSAFSFISGKKNPLTHARLKALTNKSTYSQKKILQTLGFTPSKSTAAHISDACESYIGKKVLS